MVEKLFKTVCNSKSFNTICCRESERTLLIIWRKKDECLGDSEYRSYWSRPSWNRKESSQTTKIFTFQLEHTWSFSVRLS